jgi:membrane-bound lytic murein transglycosylase
MNSNRLFIASACALLLAVSPTLASEIYKWTDEDGTVHYGDTPSGNPTEERLDVAYKRSDSNAIRGRIDARHEREANSRKAAEERDKAKQEAAEEAAAAEQKQQKCEQARDRLQSYLSARRLYREDANGERVYLDDAGIDEARQRAEEAIAEYCGS